MPIQIEKIGQQPITLLHYFSEDIFSFSLDSKELSEQARKLFSQKLPQDRFRNALKKQIAFFQGKEAPSIQEWMQLHFQHLYDAERYYTNGQQLVSQVITADGIQLGIHPDIQIAADYFSSPPTLSRFSLKPAALHTYGLQQKVDAVILETLSQLKIRRIPTKKAGKNLFLEVREVYPSNYYFRMADQEQPTQKKVNYYGDWVDKITEQIIQSSPDHEVRCCLNCTHFQFSGMSHSSSQGSIGYCNKMREAGVGMHIKNLTTHIWSSCQQFDLTSH